MIVTRTWTFLGAALAITASMLVWACESPGGGGDCFPPEHGPDGPSCVGFAVGLSCPVSLGPYYTCTCTKSSADTGADAGPPQVWDCMMSGAGGGGADGGM